MVVTFPLESIVSPGQEGAVVVAFDHRLRERYFPEWSAALGLPEIVQRRAYVNAGLLVFSGSRGADVLTTIRCSVSPAAGEAQHGGSRPGRPVDRRDQDVLNAVLMQSPAREELVVLDDRLAPFAIAAPDLSVVDLKALRCEYPDGVSTRSRVATHKKPWLAATPQNAYTQLLGRLLLADDVAIRRLYSRSRWRFGSGHIAALERARVSVAAQLSPRDQLRRLRRHLGPREKAYADARAGSDSAYMGAEPGIATSWRCRRAGGETARQGREPHRQRGLARGSCR